FRSCGRPKVGRCRGWTGTAAATTRNRRSCARSRSGGGARSGPMAVRQFDGVDDDIHHAIGAHADMQYGTVAAIFKVTSNFTSNYRTLLGLHQSNNTPRLQIYLSQPGGEVGFFNGTSPSTDSTFVPPTTDWILAVVRKPNGNALGQFSFYNFT